ncbi:unnamed protein product [Pelagomonas calceolata]|uniref:Uncharacterized protein n=1 Tax=Pelagomonas calceolata TaxID=35677 RepID=A0A7S4E785_9STRA|nr:unnamed protein product [Pelagomonas calceolata]|mmetsp:Transcript_3833/g.11268  ORF Transcript_3833/g.11268 Transcript_3833/m.11268 type:complete len:611 (-) Transcript_3833:41-1873(-)
MADTPPEPAPMEVETPPEEEEEEEVECDYPGRFKNKHKYPATGEAKSTMLAILRKMKRDKHTRVYASLTGGITQKQNALMELLKSDKALERDILDHRRKAIKQWNKERRAEDKAAAGVVDAGPVPYREAGEGLDVVAGAMRERADLLAAARERFGEELKASVLAQKLLASEAQEDRELIDKLLAHRKARYAAWRETLSGDRQLRNLGDGPRTAASAGPQVIRAAPVNWSDAAGDKGTKALEEALDPLDETPPLSDTATWDAIAKTVSAAAGRDYTGKQCYCRASGEGYLHAKLPDAHIYDPSMKNWRPRAMEHLLRAAGLDESIPCGKAALEADAFKEVSTKKLYERLGDAYNLGAHAIRGDRDKLIDALVEADMCALDPCENGATSFKRASSVWFQRALNSEMLPRRKVLASLEASEARLESPSDGDDLVRTDAAVYGRLSQKNLMCLCFREFALEPHEAPSTRMAPLLNEYFFRPPYEPHVKYDAAQDCTCCLGLYEDNGFATCLEHAHDVQLGCCAIRNNGACEFAASPSFERRLRRRRLHASSVAWSVLLFNFHTGNKCNTSWIEFFDKLAREFKIETLREKRDIAVAANKRWGHLSPRRRAWKYD